MNGSGGGGKVVGVMATAKPPEVGHAYLQKF